MQSQRPQCLGSVGVEWLEKTPAIGLELGWLLGWHYLHVLSTMRALFMFTHQSNSMQHHPAISVSSNIVM